MKLNQVKEILSAQIFCDEALMEREVASAFACDLMSDVLAFVSDQPLLLSGLINPQVVRTAEMMDMKAIVFVRGKTPTEEIVELASEANIAIMSTELTMYNACGLLYQNGLRG